MIALLSLGTVSAHCATYAQAQKVRRIGVLFPGPAAPRVRGQKLLRDALQRLGYKEGENLVIEWRFLETKSESLAGLAEDLVRQNVELIVAISNLSADAAKNATRTIPIVMHGTGTPVETGLIQSFSHPGGNITGTTFNSTETAGKTLQVLRDVVPKAKTVAVLWNPDFPGVRLYADQGDSAAITMGITLRHFHATRPDAIPGALDRIAASRPDALFVALDPVIATHIAEIAAFAVKHKLASIGTGATYVDSGGLLYYGPNLESIIERTASYVDRILRGAAPSGLPVEQATKFELVINLKTAKALRFKIPQSVLVQADRIIE